MQRIVSGDKIWIHYDNFKCKNSYEKPGQLSQINRKAENPRHRGNALYLVASQGPQGYHEVLKPVETIIEYRYRQQLIKLKRAIFAD